MCKQIIRLRQYALVTMPFFVCFVLIIFPVIIKTYWIHVDLLKSNPSPLISLLIFSNRVFTSLSSSSPGLSTSYPHRLHSAWVGPDSQPHVEILDDLVTHPLSSLDIAYLQRLDGNWCIQCDTEVDREIFHLKFITAVINRRQSRLGKNKIKLSRITCTKVIE